MEDLKKEKDEFPQKKDLKIVYDQGKRLINDLVDNYKRWLTFTSILLFLFSIISLLLIIVYKEIFREDILFFNSILYLVMGLILIYLGYFNPWCVLERQKHLVKVSKLNIKAWYGFFKRCDFNSLENEKYGLVEIILRIYYNIGYWLKINYYINQIKYQTFFIICLLLWGLILPLDNSHYPLNIIGAVILITGMIMSVFYLYRISRKQMDVEASKWHNKVKQLDSELFNLWRDR